MQNNLWNMQNPEIKKQSKIHHIAPFLHQSVLLYYYIIILYYIDMKHFSRKQWEKKIKICSYVSGEKADQSKISKMKEIAWNGQRRMMNLFWFFEAAFFMMDSVFFLLISAYFSDILHWWRWILHEKEWPDR